MLTALVIGALVTALVSLVLGGLLLTLLGTVNAPAATGSASRRPTATIHDFSPRLLTSSTPADSQRIAA